MSFVNAKYWHKCAVLLMGHMMTRRIRFVYTISSHIIDCNTDQVSKMLKS